MDRATKYRQRKFRSTRIKLIPLMLTMAPFLSPPSQSLTDGELVGISRPNKDPLGCKKSSAPGTCEARPQASWERQCTFFRWGSALEGSQNIAVRCQKPFIRLCRKGCQLSLQASSQPVRIQANSQSVRGCAGSQPEL